MPPPQPIPPPLRGRPFLLDEAIALGLSRKVLRGNRFRRLRHGVYAEASLPDDVRTRSDAVLLVLPEAATLEYHGDVHRRSARPVAVRRHQGRAPSRPRLDRDHPDCR